MIRIIEIIIIIRIIMDHHQRIIFIIMRIIIIRIIITVRIIITRIILSNKLILSKFSIDRYFAGISMRSSNFHVAKID